MPILRFSTPPLVALLVVPLVLMASIAFSKDPTPKASIPDDAAQKAAMAVVADVYKPDYEKAKTPPQKIELAKKLLGVGVATKDDPVNRFVLFRVARDIAAQQGDLKTAFSAIDRLDAEYETDALQMKVDAVTLAIKALKTPKEHQACAAILAPLIDEAIASDRYDQAKSLADLALVSAREGRDSDRIKQMVAKLKEVEEVAVEFETVKEAKATLDAKPTDPAANFAVGRFLCLVKGDWKRGVTMLALGDNEKFKAAALLELESKPDSLKLGDGWWRTAEGLEGTAKARVQAHAVEWYRKALPGLSGLTKARVEHELKGFAPEGSSQEATPLVVDLLRNLDATTGVPQGEWRLDDKGLSGEGAKASYLQFPAEVVGNYDLELRFSRVVALDNRDEKRWEYIVLTLPVADCYLNLQSNMGNRKSNASIPGIEGKPAPFDMGFGDYHVLQIRVRKMGQEIAVVLDGKTLIASRVPNSAKKHQSKSVVVALPAKVGIRISEAHLTEIP